MWHRMLRYETLIAAVLIAALCFAVSWICVFQLGWQFDDFKGKSDSAYWSFMYLMTLIGAVGSVCLGIVFGLLNLVSNRAEPLKR